MEDDDFEFGEDGEEAYEALGPMMVCAALRCAAALRCCGGCAAHSYSKAIWKQGGAVLSAATDARRVHSPTAGRCLQVDGGCVADDDAAREVCRKLQQLLLGSNGAEAVPPPKQYGHRALAGGCCSGRSASPCLLARQHSCARLAAAKGRHKRYTNLQCPLAPSTCRGPCVH